MWIAEYDSRNFSFIAVGESETHAKVALVEGLKQHAKQYGIEENWFTYLYESVEEWLDDGEVNVVELQMGQCARDGSVIK